VQKSAMMLIRKEYFEGLVNESTAWTACFWPVASRYGVARGWIWPEWDDEHFDFYVLLADPELFLSFARLGARGEPSNSAIKHWVSNHGLLTKRKEDQHAWATLEEDGGLNQASTPIGEFREEVRLAGQLLELYAQVRGREVEVLKARITDPQSLLDKQLAEAFENSAEEWGRRVSVASSELDILWLCFGVLSQAVEEKLAGVRVGVSTGPPETFNLRSPRLDQAWYCPDLLSALYMQLYLLITGNKAMGRCDNPSCGMPFPLTHRKKRFCNDTCRSNARYHRQRDNEDAE
jgi:hypothetical protein